MAELPDWWEMIKEDKHGTNCHGQWKNISLFVLSVYGMLGKEALFILSQLSRVMVAKRAEPFSQVRGWVNSPIKIAVMRSYSQTIRRD